MCELSTMHVFPNQVTHVMHENFLQCVCACKCVCACTCASIYLCIHAHVLIFLVHFTIVCTMVTGVTYFATASEDTSINFRKCDILIYTTLATKLNSLVAKTMHMLQINLLLSLQIL